MMYVFYNIEKNTEKKVTYAYHQIHPKDEGILA